MRIEARHGFSNCTVCHALLHPITLIALPANIAFFTSLGYHEVSRNAHEGFIEPTSLRM